jgi:N-acetylglucosamine kinase-like BadF-type ATPase
LESDVAKLAPLVLTEAAQGDETANVIVEQQAAILADYVFAAARRVALAGAFTLYLTGGVFRHPSRLLERALQTRVLNTEPDIEVVRSQTEPVIGALLYGLERANVEASQGIFERLSTTLPEAALFTT